MAFFESCLLHYWKILASVDKTTETQGYLTLELKLEKHYNTNHVFVRGG